MLRKGRRAQSESKGEQIMKTSIEHLPDKKQEELQELVGYILESVPEALYIILYGSYTGPNFVEYDQRTEFGLRTCFMSDFDIVVITPKKRASHKSIMHRLDNADAKFASGYQLLLKPTVEFIAMDIEEFNNAVEGGRYFYTDIREQGIVLYNSGTEQLSEVKPLKYDQIYYLSKEYYRKKYERAESFLYVAKSALDIQDYCMSAFLLHQAVENYCLAIALTASLYAPKEHNIVKIIKKTKLFTSIVADIFHENTSEDKRLLELLRKAYVQARYDKDFLVTKEDIEALLAKIEKLRIETKQFCEKTIEEHLSRFNTEQ